jgi:glycosyltransferase involved in cell wall biosynthesis
MPSKPISVTLSLGNGPYQKTLPEALLLSGMLRRVLRFGPDLEVLEPNGTGFLKIVQRYDLNFARQAVWGLWTRAPGMKHSRLPVIASAWIADRQARKWAASGNVFHGWTATCLASLQVAKQAGAATLVEYPMLHPRHWQREVLAECERFNVRPRDCPSVLPERLILRMEREFAECDKIAVPSSVACRSFEDSPYAGKAVVVRPGIDHHFFTPPPDSRRPSLFRVCYVGRLELAKGLGYLLQAWKKLALPDVQLVLIGEYRTESKSLLARFAGANVRLTNVVSPQEVARWYRESSVFVFPSVNEGFGMVLLEAMASGLAVIATERTGADDCVIHGKDGFIVPARNVDALADAILWCYRHPEETRSIGKAARAKVAAQFTLAHYNRRIIHLYQSMVSAAD